VSDAAAFAARRVPLPHGRTLVVRTVTPDDLDGLTALYEGLDPEARYRRFFNAFHPARAFYEGMTTVAERGGCELVAVVHDGTADDRGTIVAEAGFVHLPDGDGELAVTVASGWRGWLGPYLVDALLTAAAAHGVPALEADVLMINRPMLAVLRARGATVLDRPDGTYVRLLVGTGGPAPTASASGP